MSSYKHQAMLARCDTHGWAEELLRLLCDFENCSANDFLGHSIHLGVVCFGTENCKAQARVRQGQAYVTKMTSSTLHIVTIQSMIITNATNETFQLSGQPQLRIPTKGSLLQARQKMDATKHYSLTTLSSFIFHHVYFFLEHPVPANMS